MSHLGKKCTVKIIVSLYPLYCFYFSTFDCYTSTDVRRHYPIYFVNSVYCLKLILLFSIWGLPKQKEIFLLKHLIKFIIILIYEYDSLKMNEEKKDNEQNVTF